MGNPIYWLNGKSMEESFITEDVCGIYLNPYYSEAANLKYEEKKYICELILAPYHEDRIIEGFMTLKEAKYWGINEYEKRNDK